MRSLFAVGALFLAASCGLPKKVVEAQFALVNRLRQDSAQSVLRVASVRDSLLVVERWGLQSEQASLELAKELEVKTEALKLAQFRADSLQERVLRNAVQRDVWRLELLVAERAMLAARRRADSLLDVISALQIAPKKLR